MGVPPFPKVSIVHESILTPGHSTKVLGICAHPHTVIQYSKTFLRLESIRKRAPGPDLGAHVSVLTLVVHYKIWSQPSPYWNVSCSINFACIRVHFDTSPPEPILVVHVSFRQVTNSTNFDSTRFHLDTCHTVHRLIVHVTAWNGVIYQKFDCTRVNLIRAIKYNIWLYTCPFFTCHSSQLLVVQVSVLIPVAPYKMWLFTCPFWRVCHCTCV